MPISPTSPITAVWVVLIAKTSRVEDWHCQIGIVGKHARLHHALDAVTASVDKRHIQADLAAIQMVVRIDIKDRDCIDCGIKLFVQFDVTETHQNAESFPTGCRKLISELCKREI